jgi:hypothetical protein
MENILPAPALLTILLCTTICATTPAQSGTTSSADPSQSQSFQAQPAPAQSAQPQAVAGLAGQPTSIAPGTVIPVELTKTIDAKKAKAGDEVFAKVAQDLKTTSGELIVSKDTKIVGHVTEAHAHTKDQKESEVGIAFDHAITRNGAIQLSMSIQAIVALQNDSAEAGGNQSYGGSPSPSTAGAGGRSPMSGGTPPITQPPMPSKLPTPPTGSPTGGAPPPITNSTQGVIGMANVKLTANADNAAQGSVISSEKSNVRLESGTLMLLHVNP